MLTQNTIASLIVCMAMWCGFKSLANYLDSISQPPKNMVRVVELAAFINAANP